MKLFLLVLLFSSGAFAQQGVFTDYLRLQPTTLPSICNQGDVRFASSPANLNVCSSTNNWTAFTVSSQAPLTTLGDMIYENSSLVPDRIPGNTTSTQKFLSQTGTGSASAMPVWTTISGGAWGSITGTLSSQTDLNTALGLKAPLASPTFTGTVTTPLASGIVSSSSGVLGITALSGDVTSTGFATTVGKINGTALSGLATGILKNTTTTGVPSIATSGTDYVVPSVATLSSLTSVGAIATGTWNATTIAVAHGGTGQTSNITAPTATTVASWDASKNLSANATIDGFTTQATAATTTTLTVASTKTQYFTGTTTQTVLLPTTSIVAGQEYYIENKSTGVVTVQSSGANTILTLSANTGAFFTALVATPTTAANWDFQVTPSITGSSSGNILTSTGATSAPTWQAASGTSPTGSYAQAFHINGNAWTTTSTTFANLTHSVGTATLTVRNSNGITLTAGASSVAGITFTPAASTAVYIITATFTDLGDGNFHYFRFNDGTLSFGSMENGAGTGFVASYTMTGIYVPGTASAVTVQIQGAVSSTGLLTIGSASLLLGSSIEWSIVRIF